VSSEKPQTFSSLQGVSNITKYIAGRSGGRELSPLDAGAHHHPSHHPGIKLYCSLARRRRRRRRWCAKSAEKGAAMTRPKEPKEEASEESAREKQPWTVSGEKPPPVSHPPL